MSDNETKELLAYSATLINEAVRQSGKSRDEIIKLLWQTVDEEMEKGAIKHDNR